MKRTAASLGVVISALVVVLAVGSSSLGATYRDVLGRPVELKGPPARIIPLAPSLTEILFALGLGDCVVGVTQYSDYPPEAALRPKVGTYVNLNVEQIVSLGPDLVIGTVDGNKPWVVKLLEQAGIAVYIVNPRNIQEVIATISSLGEVCAVRRRADALVESLRRRVERVLEATESREKPLVFLQINLKPIMTVNRDTFHHDVIRLAGGRNLTGNEPVTYPRISLEEVIRGRPEVIVISSMERGGRFETTRQEWSRWTSIPAVRDQRVYLIESDLIDRPSPRIVDGLEAMARLLHPAATWEE